MGGTIDRVAPDGDWPAQRSVRTFHARRGRLSPELSATRARVMGRTEIDPATSAGQQRLAHGLDRGLIIDFGAGRGDTTVALAREYPDRTILAAEIHTASAARMLRAVEDAELRNVLSYQGDAVFLLREHIPASSLHGLVSMHPDPWPKARHHKRRLVRPDLVDLIVERLRPGGFWYLATDWPDYATSIVETLQSRSALTLSSNPTKPAWRVPTHYGQKAAREGRLVSDFVAIRR